MAKGNRPTPPTGPRGRPKGSTVYAEQDFRILARYADLLIDAPRAKLAPFLKDFGYAIDKDIRRARIRWSENKSRLVREAQEQRDASPADTLLQLIAYFTESAAELRDAAAPAFEAVNQSLERARARLWAIRELGLDPELPLNLRDKDAVDAAVRRYERRMFRSTAEKAGEFPAVSLKELPMSLKLYSAAMLLHELSLQTCDEGAAGRPAAAGTDSLSDRGEPS